MRWLPNISDAEIDRLLAGHQPEDSGLDDVAQFLREVDSVYAETPTAEFESAHVAAMIAAASIAATPATSQARRGHVFGFKTLAAHKWASALALSAMALLTFGGAAYAGALPEPVQEATSSIVQHVGIKIPKAHRVKQAKSNGVRDHGAGVGNGKGQGGTRRDLGNPGGGNARATGATGTINAAKVKASTATSGTPNAARMARMKNNAKNANAKVHAKAKANAKKTHRRTSARKHSKHKASRSDRDDKKSSAVEKHRGKSGRN